MTSTPTPHRPSLAAPEGYEGPRRALLFAGGGLRLSYQAGAALALEQAGMRFTHFEGTSGGGINLAMLLSGLTPAQMCARWRRVRGVDFLGLLSPGDYLKSRTAVAIGGPSGLRTKALPALGVDYQRLRAARGIEAWFNLYNFAQKRVEQVAHTETDEDVIVAGMSLPGLLPPVDRDGELYLDAGFVRDADPIEAVRRGAEEIWLLWCLGDRPEFLGGPVRVYVQTLEACAVAALHSDIERLREINDRIEAGQTVWGHTRPIRLHLLRPERPLPLDTDLYTGRTSHAALVDQGYADAVRYLQEASDTGVPLSPEVTQMSASGVGITFRETMSGGFALGETGPREGAEAGERAGTTLAMHASVTIDSMDSFVEDPGHLGELIGHIDFTPWGTGIPATRGVFNLFSPTDDPGLKYMVYELGFRHDGKPYYLAGRKEVRSDRHGVDLWSDTTTLLTTLHEGDDASGPVVGSGVLTLGVDDLARLVRTVRVTGTTSKTEQAKTLATFGAFFLGELWDSYAAPVYAPESRLRRWLGNLFGRKSPR